MKFPIERIPKEDIPEEVWAVLRPVRVVLYFCIAQTILMISIATFLDYKKAISNWMFNNLYFLVDYIPVLWKYKQIFAVLNRNSEFPLVFAGYAVFSALQIIALLAIASAIFFKIDIRAKPRIGVWQALPWAGSIILALYASADLVIGPYSLLFPASIADSAWSKMMIYCLVLPSANFLLFFLVYLPFNKFGPKLRIPVDNLDRANRMHIDLR